MLVLAGGQGLGKSVFVHWLGNVLPEYFISSAIYPDNKDFIINSASNFVWEVKELGSTTRRSDVEALKAFLDTPYATFRAPYGKHEVKKFVTASYIGTINPDGVGFLNDPTGNRRFRVCELVSIDFGYSKVMDPNQVWAQAMALFKKGETYHLDRENDAKIREMNDRHVLEDALSEVLDRYFDIDKSNTDWEISTSEILRVLRSNEITRDEVDRGIQMRLSIALKKRGLSQTRLKIDKASVRGWIGMRVKVQRFR
jgi:predicted P-loop ATPase